MTSKSTAKYGGDQGIKKCPAPRDSCCALPERLIDFFIFLAVYGICGKMKCQARTTKSAVHTHYAKKRSKHRSLNIYIYIFKSMTAHPSAQLSIIFPWALNAALQAVGLADMYNVKEVDGDGGGLEKSNTEEIPPHPP